MLFPKGEFVAETDALGNVTSYEYDNLYRLVKVTEADPDGAGSLAAPETSYAYALGTMNVLHRGL